MKTTATVQELADAIGGDPIGDGERVIAGVASLTSAGPRDIVFVDGPKHASALAACKAGAVIVPPGVEPPEGMSGIRFPAPAIAMVAVIERFHPRRRRYASVSPQAFIEDGAELASDVGVGPGACVGKGAKIGARSEIHPGATVGEDVEVGEDCVIHSGAHVYHGCRIGDRVIIHSGAVIGADGYGFTQQPTPEAGPDEPARHLKIPQIGCVVIEDDVEIGANTTIDRAAFDVTRIGRGTKIDNLVMIAHNCDVGRHSLLVAQVGISGSVKLGNYVTVAGQAGTVGHIEIGDRAIVGAQAGITKDVPPGAVVMGAPAIEARDARRAYALIPNLPQYKRQLSDHEQRLRALEVQDDETSASDADSARHDG